MKTAFDFTPYRFTLDDTDMAMDELHIQFLRASIQLLGPRYRCVAEIGSYKGASTAALIDALNCGVVDEVHLFEINPTPELHKVISMAREPQKVILHTTPFWESDIAPDFVFIDGDHQWPALADTLAALVRSPQVICMHDSNSHPRYDGTWGSKLAADILKKSDRYAFFEDKEDRPGMKTHRGFLVASQGDLGIDGHFAQYLP